MKLLGTVAIEPNPNRPDFYGALYTDGTRWAAYEPTTGVTRIVNTITGGSINRPDPASCNGELIAVGGGELLYACADPECPGEADLCPIKPAEEYETARFMIEDIVGAAQHPLAGESHLPTSNSSEGGGAGIIETIGRQWVRGVVGTHVGGATFFVNWRTGVIEKEERTLGDAAFYADLNSQELLQSLCEPLTRPLSDDPGPPPFAPIQYESPFAVIGPLGYEQIELQLRRCGSNKRIVLPESGPYASSVQLGGHVLSWMGSGTRRNYTSNVGAYVTRLLPQGRSWHGPFYKLVGFPGPKVFNNSNPPILQHTSRMVFITVMAEGSKSAQIYSARLPWISVRHRMTSNGRG